MASLILTRGLNAPQTLADPVAVGLTTLPLTQADQSFASGELLFLGDVDFATAQSLSTEFLGLVTEVGASSISFTLPTQILRPSGATLWTPIEEFRSTARFDSPVTHRFHTGVHTQRTLGGRIFSIRTAEAVAELEFQLVGMTPDEEERLVDWIRVVLDHGLFPFTFVASSRRVGTLHLSGERFERTSLTGGRRTIRLRAFDLGNGVAV